MTHPHEFTQPAPGDELLSFRGGILRCNLCKSDIVPEDTEYLWHLVKLPTRDRSGCGYITHCRSCGPSVAHGWTALRATIELEGDTDGDGAIVRTTVADDAPSSAETQP